MIMWAAYLTFCVGISCIYSAEILPVNNTIACGSDQPQIVESEFGFLLSPNFDNFHFYPPNARCSWILKAPENKVVMLKNMAFGMNTNCNIDGVVMYEGLPPNGTKIGVFCGYFFPPTYRSKTSTLLIRFYTGPEPVYTGFQFYFQYTYPRVQCSEDEILCRHMTSCVEKTKLCDGFDDCTDGTDEENCNKILIESACGRPNIPPVLESSRIVGGRDAAPGSWPWQVSFRQIDMIPFSHMCGGSLITRQWILTAAHCFKKKMNVNLWNVLLGKHFKLIPDEKEQLRYIKAIHIHPDYNMETKLSDPWIKRKQHDIALVELNAPVVVNDFVSPVCLPTPETRLSPGNVCYVTGWGETYGTGYELVLKQAAVPVISHESCRKMHFLYPIAETMICAGYPGGGQDSCQGDSGGPLVFQGYKKKWTLAGIVSTGGSICAAKNMPGIYTYVPYYMKWIENVTGILFPRFQ